MNFLKTGICLFVISTSLGILGLVVFTSFQDILDFIYKLNPYAQGLITLGNLIVWITSVILIIIGLKKKSSKRLKKKEDELQELKDKVARLEKDKEKKD